MPHELDLIVTLTAGFTVALAFGLGARRIGLSPMVGYLLGGIVIGPHTPGFVAHAAIAEQLAELGVILLMFGVGLSFHVRELAAVRKVAIPGAIAQIGAATGLGLLLAHAVGLGLGGGLVFGLAVSVASTVALLRVLSDRDALHTPAGHVAVGWLLVEDVFTVLVLVLLPTLTGPSKGGLGAALTSIGLAIAKVAVLVALMIVVGRRAIPRLLGHVAKTRSRELFTLAVLVIALGIAATAAILFGASMALGAFLAGMVVGQSELGSRAASEVLPMRDAFAVLFFVAMGMLLDPAALLPNAGFVAATLAIILIGKPLVALLVVLALRQPARTALTVAVALAQIGEFSFILASLAKTLGIFPERAMQALVAASIASIAVNPLLFRIVDPLVRWAEKRRPAVATAPPRPEAPSHRAIVVGHGPVGRTLTRILRQEGIEPTVVELNHETVADLGRRGIRAVYGDASQPHILEVAGIREAGALVFSASTPPEAVIRAAEEMNPDVLVLARAALLGDAARLRDAGADVVVTSEAEVAMAMAESLLRRLGATDEQIDREREKVRSELAPAE
jgi:monovalent cation:H+ antiporter-2, CPA2 family